MVEGSISVPLEAAFFPSFCIASDQDLVPPEIAPHLPWDSRLEHRRPDRAFYEEQRCLSVTVAG